MSKKDQGNPALEPIHIDSIFNPRIHVIGDKDEYGKLVAKAHAEGFCSTHDTIWPHHEGRVINGFAQVFYHNTNSAPLIAIYVNLTATVRDIIRVALHEAQHAVDYIVDAGLLDPDTETRARLFEGISWAVLESIHQRRRILNIKR